MPQWGSLRCSSWSIESAGELVRREPDRISKRTFRLVPDAPAVEWLAIADESSMSRSGGSGEGRASVTAAAEDVLVIQGLPWFTEAAACEAAIRSAFPSGCEEP